MPVSRTRSARPSPDREPEPQKIPELTRVHRRCYSPPKTDLACECPYYVGHVSSPATVGQFRFPRHDADCKRKKFCDLYFDVHQFWESAGGELYPYAVVLKAQYDNWRNREPKQEPRLQWSVWLPLTIGDTIVVLTTFPTGPDILRRRMRWLARTDRNAQLLGGSGLVSAVTSLLNKPWTLLDPTRPISRDTLANLVAAAAKAWEYRKSGNITNWSGVPTFREVERLSQNFRVSPYIYNLSRRFLMWSV